MVSLLLWKQNKQNISRWAKGIPTIDYVSMIADGTSVSIFLCTWKLWHEELSVTAV